LSACLYEVRKTFIPLAAQLQDNGTRNLEP
jgi:hypothetical protein